MTSCFETMNLDDRTVKYSTLPYEWYEANGDHIFTLEINVVPIEDSNDVSVEVIDGRKTRIEFLEMEEFYCSDGLSQLGIKPNHTMVVARTNAIRDLEEKYDCLSKRKKVVYYYRAPFNIEASPVSTLDGLKPINLIFFAIL